MQLFQCLCLIIYVFANLAGHSYCRSYTYEKNEQTFHSTVLTLTLQQTAVLNSCQCIDFYIMNFSEFESKVRAMHLLLFKRCLKRKCRVLVWIYFTRSSDENNDIILKLRMIFCCVATFKFHYRFCPIQANTCE